MHGDVSLLVTRVKCVTTRTGSAVRKSPISSAGRTCIPDDRTVYSVIKFACWHFH